MRVPRAAFSSCAILVAIATFVTPLFPQNVITIIAGTDWLFPADGRQALDAPLGGVVVLGIAVDKQGNYYIADPDNIMVFKVTPDGILSRDRMGGIGEDLRSIVLASGRSTLAGIAKLAIAGYGVDVVSAARQLSPAATIAVH